MHSRNLLSASILLILCLGLGLLPCNLQAQHETLPVKLKQQEKLMKKRDVQIVRAYLTLADEDEQLEFVRMYNELGQLIKSVDYDEYEDTYLTATYDYNESGMLIQKNQLDEQEEVASVSEFEYGPHGLVRESHFTMDGAYDIVYNYNDQGRVDTSKVIDAEFRLNTWHYTGSRLDSILGYTVYDLDKPDAWELVDVEKFTYGRKRRITTYTFCSNYSGCTINSYTYKRKQLIREVVDTEGERMLQAIYTYDKKLLRSSSLLPSESFADYIDAETIRYVYEFY